MDYNVYEFCETNYPPLVRTVYPPRIVTMRAFSSHFHKLHNFWPISMADDSLNKSFDIMKLTVTALMLDLVSLKLVVVEEGLEQFAGVHPILEWKDCVHLPMSLEKRNIFIRQIPSFSFIQLCLC